MPNTADSRRPWREQPCWTCEKSEDYTACPWAGGVPRDDWEAEETTILGSCNEKVQSFDIKRCPGYKCDVKPRVQGDNPTEAQEQSALVKWAELMLGRFPELVMLTHVPNEGMRSPVTGARLKEQGMKRGFPDLILPVPRGVYHGLFIEMKRAKGGKVSDEQRWWIDHLREQGYRAEVCKGAQAAALLIEHYLLGCLD